MKERKSNLEYQLSTEVTPGIKKIFLGQSPVHHDSGTRSHWTFRDNHSLVDDVIAFINRDYPEPMGKHPVLFTGKLHNPMLDGDFLGPPGGMFDPMQFLIMTNGDIHRKFRMSEEIIQDENLHSSCYPIQDDELVDGGICGKLFSRRNRYACALYKDNENPDLKLYYIVDKSAANFGYSNLKLNEDEVVPSWNVWPANRVGQRYSNNRVFVQQNFPDFGLTIPGISKIDTPSRNRDGCIGWSNPNRHFPSLYHNKWTFMSTLTVMPRDNHGNIHSPQWVVHRTREERTNCVKKLGLLREDVSDSDLDIDFDDDDVIPQAIQEMVIDEDVGIPDQCSQYAYKVGSLDLLRSTDLENHGQETENDDHKLEDQTAYDKYYGTKGEWQQRSWIQKQATTPQMREIISINSIFMHYFQPAIKQIYYGTRYQRNLIDVHYYHNRSDWIKDIDERIESRAKKIQDVVRMKKLKTLLDKKNMPTKEDLEIFAPFYGFLPRFIDALFGEMDKMIISYHVSATTMPNHPSAQVITDEMKKTEQTIIWFAKMKDIFDFSMDDYNTFDYTIETFNRIFRCKITNEVKEKYYQKV